MPKRSSKEEPDINQMAAAIVAHTTNGNGQITKNPAAVALGRLGGLKGGRARAENLTPEQRKEIAKRAAFARWSKRS